ncbi:MAG: PKD domain-containing protein, partial [Deltaproteobacteria bacterium]|nr:PKD domain-containing protein [Deltaproteobacteria bacterium]
MKRNRLFVIWSLFVAMTLSLAACGGDTVNPFDATIAASVEQGVAPLAVDFTATVNTGNEPYTFAWDFGDGGTSGEQNPSHTFNTAGEYAVTVSIGDAKDRSIERSLTLLVIDSLVIEMAVEPTDGMAPLLVEVSSLATGGMPPYAYAWNFGDGGSSDQASASHLYAMAGTFDLSLTVTDSQGASVTDTATVQVNDDHVPVAAIRANPTVGVAPLDVGFFGSAVGGDAPLSYSWHFGDGENSAEQNPSHTFVEAGVYTVILQVEDADGDSGQATVEVQVASNEVPAVEIGASPIEGIEPLDVQFVANAAGGNVPLTFAWDFDADGVTDSMQMTPMHTFAAGSHEVSLTVTDVDGDTATDTVTIEVDADTEPEVTVAADPASGQAPLTVGFTCSATGINLPYTYNWDFGNGQMSNLQNPTYTYAEAGLYTAACSVTDADGDFAVGTVEVQVDADLAPQVTIQADP